MDFGLPGEIDKSKLETLTKRTAFMAEELKSKLLELNFDQEEIQIILEFAQNKISKEKLGILKTLKNIEFGCDFSYTLGKLGFDISEKYIVLKEAALQRASDITINGPLDIAVDKSGNVYVPDFYLNRIQKFDSSGNFITKWDTSGTPRAIEIDSGNYVC